MSMITKIATAGAVAAVMGMGLGAASASAAFDLTGGDYSGSNTGDHVFTAGGYPVTCTGATFTGNTENGSSSARTLFTPAYSNCDLAGFPADVTISGPWQLEVTGTLATTPKKVYSGNISLPGTSSIKIDVPILGCEVTVTTPQTFVHGSGGNSLTGTDNTTYFTLDASVNGIAYTTNGLCPFGNGSDGTYTGVVDISGVSVDEV